MGKCSMYGHFPLYQDICVAHRNTNETLFTRLGSTSICKLIYEILCPFFLFFNLILLSYHSSGTILRSFWHVNSNIICLIAFLQANKILLKSIPKSNLINKN